MAVNCKKSPALPGIFETTFEEIECMISWSADPQLLQSSSVLADPKSSRSHSSFSIRERMRCWWQRTNFIGGTQVEVVCTKYIQATAIMPFVFLQSVISAGCDYVFPWSFVVTGLGPQSH